MLETIKEISSSFFGANGENRQAFPEPPIGAETYAASATVNLLALALPLTVLQVYDRVLPNAAFETLALLIIILCCAVCIDAALKYLRSKVVNWSAASFTHKLSVDAFTSMLSTKPSRFSQTTSSEHLERYNSISGLGNHISAHSRIVIVDILFIPVFSAVILLIGGWIFASVVFLFAIFGYMALKSTRSINDLIAEREQLDSRKQDFIIEILGAIHTVKANAMEPLIMRRFERLQSSASLLTRRMILLNGYSQTYQAAYASLSTISIVAVGAVLAINGRLTLGALACCMLLSSQLLQPLLRSLSSWNETKLAKHRQTRVEALFETCPHQSKVSEPFFPKRFTPKSVRLKSVTIQRGEALPLFEDLSFDIKAGSFIAIKGVDGSGRSTLLRALRYDAPITKGEIIFGDGSLAKNSEAAVRASVRYVGQTPVIFRGSILDNITLFGETPVHVALSASKFVGLDEEIARMPLGYDTVLKSNVASDLPAPTAQRITLARALAMRPSVLILDEANTLLDFAGEQQFIRALEKLRGKTTIILSSHRPSMLRLADQVYEIKGLKLVATSVPDHFRQATAS
ncbi:ABC transporter transmembrane domain-containing protein [Hyphococcus flavus]|uniref:ABC transporter transmembrane domain-containing protein n=1 Tax=Hyphococcus flavus TaxID=1866326 RepID=A0AAF0CB75_9PROT|nr:ABC transporter transmembrane domain-containing protein [Hyphococcus flavus]WDI30160.1 ABC transporter transmembrane domain-containing protein [Hyphococcus flavus]